MAERDYTPAARAPPVPSPAMHLLPAFGFGLHWKRGRFTSRLRTALSSQIGASAAWAFVRTKVKQAGVAHIILFPAVTSRPQIPIHPFDVALRPATAGKLAQDLRLRSTGDIHAQRFRSKLRCCIASDTCRGGMSASPTRSAMMRATFSILLWARAISRLPSQLLQSLVCTVTGAIVSPLVASLALLD